MSPTAEKAKCSSLQAGGLRLLVDAYEVNGGLATAVEPGARERERRPVAGAHAEHAVVPFRHALDVGGVDVDVVELLDLHGLHGASPSAVSGRLTHRRSRAKYSRFTGAARLRRATPSRMRTFPRRAARICSQRPVIMGARLDREGKPHARRRSAAIRVAMLAAMSVLGAALAARSSPRWISGSSTGYPAARNRPGASAMACMYGSATGATGRCGSR